MNTLPYQPEIAERMNTHAEYAIGQDAQFYRTQNGYWIAWQADSATAAVLPPNLPDSEPCDWVEGIEDLAELVDLVESGEYEVLLAADDDGGHAHECGCGCYHH